MYLFIYTFLFNLRLYISSYPLSFFSQVLLVIVSQVSLISRNIATVYLLVYFFFIFIYQYFLLTSISPFSGAPGTLSSGVSQVSLIHRATYDGTFSQFYPCYVTSFPTSLYLPPQVFPAYLFVWSACFPR